MIDQILKASKSDQDLSKLLETVREYAQVYLFAKQRQKGCNGFGEVTNLREEFKEVVDKMIKYCKEKKYIPDDFKYDIELITEEILKGY